MLDLFCFALIPVIAMAVAGRKRTSAGGVVFIAAQYLVFALLITQITAIVMIPIDRAAIRVMWNGMGGVILHVAYGAVSAVMACVLAVILGFIVRVYTKKRNVRMCVKEERVPVHVSVAGVLIHVCAFILLLLTMSYAWALGHFGNVGFAQIEFHLRVPLEGTANDLIQSYLKHGLRPAFGWMLLLEALVFFPAKKSYGYTYGSEACVLMQVFPLRVPPRMAAVGFAVWFVFLLVGFSDSFGLVKYMSGRLSQSQLIEEEYVDPRSVQITFPKEKRNLITIYVESAETTVFDKENGGVFEVNYMPEMARLAEENISFSHSDKLEGAAIAPECGWTIAALVAETAGLPLRLYDRADNVMDRFSIFMPGATTLGDILKEAGYRTMFMCGSDFTFGGRRAYFEQHGDYEVRDFLAARSMGQLPKDYYAGWGFEDEKLYEWARKELSALSQSGEPFHFSMLTIDTHSPNGYICRLCPDTYETDLENVMSCASRQLDEFVSWCSEQPFYENTTIVILGDHASMAPELFSNESFSRHSGNADRKVYNAFINAVAEPAKEEGRLFTTLDFFPTTLAAMGVTIEGERLGIGTNLFSEKQTLAEEYGYTYLFDELEKNSTFYNETIMFP